MGKFSINTFYNKHYFRSRLEARWAVFFDSLGVKWHYEFDGFDLGDGQKYLPDFYFPKLDFFGEVKPESMKDNRWKKFVELNKKPLVLFCGTPNMKVTTMLNFIQHTICPKTNDVWCPRTSHPLDLPKTPYFCEECKNKTKKEIVDFIDILPFAFISKESYGKFWYAGGDEDWSDDEPFNTAIIKANCARFENY